MAVAGQLMSDRSTEKGPVPIIAATTSCFSYIDGVCVCVWPSLAVFVLHLESNFRDSIYYTLIHDAILCEGGKLFL